MNKFFIPKFQRFSDAYLIALCVLLLHIRLHSCIFGYRTKSLLFVIYKKKIIEIYLPGNWSNQTTDMSNSAFLSNCMAYVCLFRNLFPSDIRQHQLRNKYVTLSGRFMKKKASGEESKNPDVGTNERGRFCRRKLFGYNAVKSAHFIR